MSKIMTPAEFATEVNSDGRTVRKFLRSITPREEQPGKGSRWQLDGTKRSVTTLKNRFAKWTEEQEKARAERAEKAAQDADETPAEDEVDDSELELDEE